MVFHHHHHQSPSLIYPYQAISRALKERKSSKPYSHPPNTHTFPPRFTLHVKSPTTHAWYPSITLFPDTCRFSKDCSSLHSVRYYAMGSMRAYSHLWISVHSLVENVRWTKGWNIMPTSDSVSRCSRAPSHTRRHTITLLGIAVSICPAASNAATRPPGKVVRVKPGQLVPGRVQSDRPGRYACDCTACQHVRSALHM